ncbi:hypothetical protein, partial [Mycobacteroides abscessus]|uniref:hypothetical protein n=1 Tax=Mycobacteroides abscessus TaxID=36809 RepID=UPI001F2F159C
RANAGLDRIPDSVMIILGKVRPLSGHLLGPHPQVLIIARRHPGATQRVVVKRVEPIPENFR